ncbi:MAG: AsnC family transcriptional regulator [Geminicoccaceae bacterium]|nr:AsnC family transcriptional regulator [Geminicoccaceae bacterium]
MDATDRRLVNALQGGFPVAERPFAEIGAELGLSEQETIARLATLRGLGTLSRFGPMFDAERLGGAVTLCAMQVPEERFDEVTDIVNAFDEVAHNYARNHELNMWFVLAVGDPGQIDKVVARIEEATGLVVLNLPKLDEYFLELKLSA